MKRHTKMQNETLDQFKVHARRLGVNVIVSWDNQRIAIRRGTHDERWAETLLNVAAKKVNPALEVTLGFRSEIFHYLFLTKGE